MKTTRTSPSELPSAKKRVSELTLKSTIDFSSRMFASLETKLSFRRRKADNDDDTEARAGAHFLFYFSMTICHQMILRETAWDANFKVEDSSQNCRESQRHLFFLKLIFITAHFKNSSGEHDKKNSFPVILDYKEKVKRKKSLETIKKNVLLFYFSIFFCQVKVNDFAFM